MTDIVESTIFTPLSSRQLTVLDLNSFTMAHAYYTENQIVNDKRRCRDG